jgi:hypothetical protein
MKVMLIYIAYESYAPTLHENIDSFGKYSKHNVVYVKLDEIEHVAGVFDNFDAIVVHWSVCVFYDGTFPAEVRMMLRKFTGAKILFIQDEYRNITDVHENLLLMKIDTLFTLAPVEAIPIIYPKSVLGDITIIQCLAGYVPDIPSDLELLPYKQRSMDVFYRGRELPFWMGRHSYDKSDIAVKFLQHLKLNNITNFNVDIAYKEQDRVYKDWYTCLGSAKAVLGVESGAEVWDLDGSIRAKIESFVENSPSLGFEEIEKRFFTGMPLCLYHMISPRCFECAMLKTLMVLYEGEYSGILIPNKHYIPLKKDFSNIEQVLLMLQDADYCQRIIDQAYADVASNNTYTYEYFINSFDKELERIHANVTAKSY